MLITDDGSFVCQLIHKGPIHSCEVERSVSWRARDIPKKRWGIAPNSTSTPSCWGIDAESWPQIHTEEVKHQIRHTLGKNSNYVWVIIMVINMLATAWYMTLQPKDSQFILKRCISIWMRLWTRPLRLSGSQLIMSCIKLISLCGLAGCAGEPFRGFCGNLQGALGYKCMQTGKMLSLSEEKGVYMKGGRGERAFE